MHVALVLLGLAAATEGAYTVRVIDRSLTSRPLLAYPETSFSPNTLNAAWLPFAGGGGGLRAEGGDVFTVFAGAGDSVVEAFRIEVRATAD